MKLELGISTIFLLFVSQMFTSPKNILTADSLNVYNCVTCPCFCLRIRLRPRILRDVSTSDTRTTIQGTEISFPVGIAPTAFHCLAWHEGEVATARGENRRTTAEEWKQPES